MRMLVKLNRSSIFFSKYFYFKFMKKKCIEGNERLFICVFFSWLFWFTRTAGVDLVKSVETNY